MPYILGPLPKEAPPYLTRELWAIAESQTQPQQATDYYVSAVEPIRPREGKLAVADGVNWDPGYGFGPYIFLFGVWMPMFGASLPDGIMVACSDQTSDITTGQKNRINAPYPVLISDVIADFTTAPTGAAAIIDVKANGTSILSTKITVDAGEKTSLTAAVPAVISTPKHIKGTEFTFHVDQVGSTVAGAGLHVTLGWARVSAAFAASP